jgi:hypothetical protein
MFFTLKFPFNFFEVKILVDYKLYLNQLYQGTLPLPGLPPAGVCQEGGDDPPLQVAQEARRVAPARIHALLARRRLQRPLPRMPPQPQADPLPLRHGKYQTAAEKLGPAFCFFFLLFLGK